MTSIPPNTSLFLQNLEISIKKDELRRTLYSLFSSYGKVIGVVATRTDQSRGTAFVVFKDLQASTAAMRGLDGEAFYGRQLRISYARSQSHATIALNEGPEAVYAIKAGLRTAAEKVLANAKLTVSGAQKAATEEKLKKKRGREDETVEEEEDDEEEEEDGPEKKKGKGKADEDAMDEDSDEDTPMVSAKSTSGKVNAAQGTDPNSVLFIEGLPSEVSTEMLSPLFQQYPGLSSLKLLATPAGSAPNSGSGFVQYESVVQATTAKDALDGFLLTKGVKMSVHWAQRG